MINIPVEIGDTILTGKFKNKVTVVKEIGIDDYGMPTINGKKVVTFRIKKKEKQGENKMATKKKEKLEEGLVMISSLLPVGQLIGMPPKRKDNFVFKGLPGQFDKNGVKTLDEFGDPIKEEKVDEKYTGPRADQHYKKILDQVKEGLEELQDVGEDYGVFQDAKYAEKTLKKVYEMIRKVR